MALLIPYVKGACPLPVSTMVTNYDASWPHMGGENNLGACLPKPLQLPDKGIQIHRALKCHLHQHGIIPCHTAAFHDIGDIFRIIVEFGFVFRQHVDADKGNDMVPQLHGICLGVIAGNHPILLHLLNPR